MEQLERLRGPQSCIFSGTERLRPTEVGCCSECAAALSKWAYFERSSRTSGQLKPSTGVGLKGLLEAVRLGERTRGLPREVGVGIGLGEPIGALENTS